MAKAKYFYIVRTNGWNPRYRRHQEGNFIVKINRYGFNKEKDGRLSYGKEGFTSYIDDWYGTIKKARKELRKLRG